MQRLDTVLAPIEDGYAYPSIKGSQTHFFISFLLPTLVFLSQSGVVHGLDLMALLQDRTYHNIRSINVVGLL